MIGYKLFYRDEKGLFTKPDRKQFYFTENKINSEKVKLEVGRKGLHFCKKVESVPHTILADFDTELWKVEAVGKIVSDNDNDLHCTDKLKLIEKMPDEFYRKLFKFDKNCNIRANHSKGKNMIDVFHVDKGEYISNSSYIQKGAYIRNGSFILNSNNINSGEFIHDSEFVVSSNQVESSKYIFRSYQVMLSNDICNSSFINLSDHVIEGRNIDCSFGICFCEHLSRSAFCYDVTHGRNMLFNKKVKSELYIEDVIENLNELLLNEIFINKGFLYFGEKETLRKNYIEMLKEARKKTKWGIPKKALEYITSLKEFNSEIFKTITGIKI